MAKGAKWQRGDYTEPASWQRDGIVSRRRLFWLAVLPLAAAAAGCVSTGDVKGRAYMDSNKSGEAFIEYRIPVNK